MSQSLPALRQLPRRDDRARWLAEAALCQAGVGEWSQAADLLQESANHWHDCEQFLAEAETLARLAAWREYGGDLTGAARRPPTGAISAGGSNHHLVGGFLTERGGPIFLAVFPRFATTS